MILNKRNTCISYRKVSYLVAGLPYYLKFSIVSINSGEHGSTTRDGNINLFSFFYKLNLLSYR